MSSPQRAGYDPTHYPVEDDVGESLLQRNLTEELRADITSLAAERGEVMLVGASQFIYYRQFRPTDSVCPDVYVLPGVAPDTPIAAWKVWETGIVPSFAMEVVSTDVRKDYEKAPRRYADLGVPELVIFDPDYHGHRDRVRWQVHRQVGGALSLVTATNDDRVRSSALECWLRAVGQGSSRRVRLASDPQGEVLIATPLEVERAEKVAEREEKIAERARREAAEAEVAALRQELDRLHKGR